MGQDGPDKRIADLEGQLAEQRWTAQPEHRQAEAVQRAGLTAEDVRNVAFSESAFGERGYKPDEVDAFLGRVEAALQEQTRHTLTLEQVRNTAFGKPPIGRRGYAVADVDAFLDRVEIELTRRAGHQPVAYQGAGGSQHHGAPAAVPSRRRGGWGMFVPVLFVSVVVIALGAVPMWVQHFGDPDRITVEICGKPSKRSLLFDYTLGTTCHGETQETRVEFWGAYQKDQGHDIDVHVMGVEAVKDGWILPPIVLGVGCVLGAGPVIAILRRLRRAPT